MRAAVQYYIDRLAELGWDFRHAVSEAISLITDHPEVGAPHHNRKLRLSGYVAEILYWMLFGGVCPPAKGRWYSRWSPARFACRPRRSVGGYSSGTRLVLRGARTL